jgi:hypothetical protein
MRPQHKPEARAEEPTREAAAQYLDNSVSGEYHARPTYRRRRCARQRNKPKVERTIFQDFELEYIRLTRYPR